MGSIVQTVETAKTLQAQAEAKAQDRRFESYRSPFLYDVSASRMW